MSLSNSKNMRPVLARVNKGAYITHTSKRAGIKAGQIRKFIGGLHGDSNDYWCGGCLFTLDELTILRELT